jgi:autotransporter-associated beta strand protein
VATIDAGGRIAPGNSIGTMNSGDLTLHGALEIEVGGTVNDLLASSGAFNLGATSVLDVLGITDNDFAPFTIVTAQAGVNGTFGSFNLHPNYSIEYNPNSIRLVFNASDEKVWTGAAASPTLWDDGVTANWTGVPPTFSNARHDNVIFDDTAVSTNVVVSGGDVLPATIAFNNSSKDYTLTSSAGSAVGGLGGLEKRGSGKLTIAGPNTFSGAASIRGGVVSVNALADGGVASPLGSGTVINMGGDSTTLDPGVLQYTGSGNTSTNRAVVISGPGGGGVDITNNVTATFAGAVSGDGAFTKRGAGTAVLSNAANSFSGPINIDQGTLRVGGIGAGANPIALGALGGATPGTLDYTGTTRVSDRGLLVNAGTVNVANAGTNLTLSGPSGGLNFNKTGTGTLTLGGQLNLTGNEYNVSEGTLSLTSAGNSIATGANINVAAGTVLSVRDGSMGGATAKLNGGTLRIAANASGLIGQFYQTSGGEITANNGGGNATGSSIFNNNANLNDFLANKTPQAVVGTTAAGATAFIANNAGNLNPTSPWGVVLTSPNDNIAVKWSGKINITNPGAYSFTTSSDDGSVMFIDGIKVVDFNRLGGFATSAAGTINLTQGLHDIVIAFYENTGGAGIEARWTPPGGTNGFLPNNVLMPSTAGANGSFTSANVELTTASVIEHDAGSNASFGNLTMPASAPLTHNGMGATRFLATTLTSGPGSTYTFNVNNGVLGLGQVAADSAIINKNGTGNLVIGSGGSPLAAGSAINVNGGSLVVVGEEGQQPPLGSAPITFNAGSNGLQLSSKFGNIPFNNAITANTDIRISASATEGGVANSFVNFTSPVTVNGGRVVTIGVDDNYNMFLSTAINGASGITFAGGAGVVDLQTSQNTGTLRVDAGNVNITTPQTATVGTFVGGVYQSDAIANGNAKLTSPSLTIGNRGVYNANIAAGLPVAATVNTGGTLNANTADSLQGVAVTVPGGNAQFWVDGASPTSVVLSNNGRITGRIQDTSAEPRNIRILPTFSVAAGQRAHLVADRDGTAGAVQGRAVAPIVNLGDNSILNLLPNNNTQVEATTINISGTMATVNNDASSSGRARVGNVNGGTATFRITGDDRTRLVGNVTAGQMVVNGSVDVAGESGTSNINAPVQVNNTFTAFTGTTNVGNNVITGESTRSTPGLVARAYQFTANPSPAFFDTLAAINTNYTATGGPTGSTMSGPFRSTDGGQTNMNFPGGADPIAPFATIGFQGTNQFAIVFRGQIYLPSVPTTLFTNSDDGSMIFVGGVNAPLVNNNGNHGAQVREGTTSLSGWQDVVIGYYAATGTDVFTASIGANGTFIPNTLLRTVDANGVYGGTVNVEAGSTLNAGGFGTLGTLNLNGGNTAAGVPIVNLANTSAHSGVVSVANVNTAGVLSLSGNNTLVAETLNISDNGSFDIEGAGTLRVANGHSLGAGSTTSVTGSKFLINGTGPGSGGVIVRTDGTIGGAGTILGTATVGAGGHIAPGNGDVGTFTLGGLFLEGDSLLDLEGIAATFDRINVSGTDTFVLPTTGNATINLADLGGLVAGDYTIIDYNGFALSDADVSSKLLINQMSGFNASVVHDSANTQIKLHLEAVAGGSPQWNLATGGSWGVAANWSPAVVPGGNAGQNAVANMLGKLTAPVGDIALDGSRTVNQLNFDNPNTYNLVAGSDPGSTLTLDGAGAAINVDAGTQRISVPVVLSSSAGVAVKSGAALELNGGLRIAAGTTATKSDPGTVTVAGAQQHGAGSALVVTKGRLNLNSNAGATGAGNLALRVTGNAQNEAAAVALGSHQDVKELVVASGDAGTQTLDLNSPVASGGFNQINVYAADLTGAKIALYDSIVRANAANAADPFDGIIDSNKHAGANIGLAQIGDHISIRSTRTGDLNLDGTVTIADFLGLAGKFNTVGTATWQDGDLNYDRSVTIADFLALAGNFNSSYTGSLGEASAEDFQLLASFASSHGVDPSVIGSAVPEPATLSLLAVGAIGLMGRRRRKA